MQVRRSWTLSDLTSLRELYHKGWKIPALATHFQRTDFAITHQLKLMHVIEKHPRSRLWTAEEHEKFCKDVLAGKSYKEISAKGGRSLYTLRQRASRYGITNKVDKAAIRELRKLPKKTPRVVKTSSVCYTCENRGVVWNMADKENIPCPACK